MDSGNYQGSTSELVAEVEKMNLYPLKVHIKFQLLCPPPLDFGMHPWQNLSKKQSRVPEADLDLDYDVEAVNRF